MGADRAYAAMLAEKISATITEECLSWGEAINAVEKAKKDGAKPEHVEALLQLSKTHGMRVAQLSAGIAEKLRPR